MHQRWVQVTQVTDQGVWVMPLEAESVSDCDQCSTGSGCAARWRPARQRVFLEHAQQDPDLNTLQVGQKLALSYPDETQLLGASLIFGLPLLGAMLGLVLGALTAPITVFSDDVSGVLGIMVGLMLSGCLLRCLNDQFLKDRLLPKVEAQALRAPIGYTSPHRREINVRLLS